MNFNQKDLMKYFRINKKDSMGFILMLMNLEDNEKFRSPIATIQKKTDSIFEIKLKDPLENLIELWIEDSKTIEI